MGRPEQPTISIGRFTEWKTSRIDPGAAIAFAKATNDPNQATLSGRVVPAMMSAGLILEGQNAAQLDAVPEGAIPDMVVGVHAQHDVVFHAPLEPGMEIRFRAAARSIFPTKPGPMLTVEIQVVDDADVLLQQHLWSTIFLGGSGDMELGPPLPDHLFAESARSSPIGRRTMAVDQDQGFRYAGVSGDRPGHALDDVQARSEGFPGKIVQGMCTFSMCAGAAVAELAGGEPSRLRRLAGRFARPVQPGHDLHLDFYENGRSPDGRRVVAFEAISGDDVCVKHGLVEVDD